MAAKMIPSVMQETNNSYGEQEIFDSLKNNLGPDYYVFHSVRWNDIYDEKRAIWGESDFTVFHPKKGIIVIEVKSGGVICNNNEWEYVRTDNGKHYPMKNPLKQADRCKYRFTKLIEERFEDKGLQNNRCQIEPAVWFPSVEERDSIGEMPMEYHDEIVLLKEALKNPEVYINKIYDFYKMGDKCNTYLSMDAADEIVKAFAPCFQANASLSSRKKENELVFMRFTEEQNGLVNYLCEQQVAAIQGAAGTGKTILAKKKAQDLAVDGKVLFLCYNTLLANELRENKKNFPKEYENIDFYSIKSFVCSILSVPDVEVEDIISFLKHFEDYNLDYKHIIIDEAQDFKSEYIKELYDIALLNDGAFYVFYDKRQAVQSEFPQWLKDNIECRLVLNINCRNTQRIAKTSGKPVGVEPNVRKTVIGDIPKLYLCENRREIEKRLRAMVTKYTQNEYKPEQICIITMKTLNSSILSGLSRINSFDVVNERKDGKILFTTARKFKGLEADVVIIVDLDDKVFEPKQHINEVTGEREISNQESRMLFYVGASRAKYNLELIVTGGKDTIATINRQLELDDGKLPALPAFLNAMGAKHVPNEEA